MYTKTSCPAPTPAGSLAISTDPPTPASIKKVICGDWNVPIETETRSFVLPNPVPSITKGTTWLPTAGELMGLTLVTVGCALTSQAAEQSSHIQTHVEKRRRMALNAQTHPLHARLLLELDWPSAWHVQCLHRDQPSPESAGTCLGRARAALRGLWEAGQDVSVAKQVRRRRHGAPLLAPVSSDRPRLWQRSSVRGTA